MDLRSKSDLLSGVCIVAFGIYVVYEGFRLSYISEFGPSPGCCGSKFGLVVVAFSSSAKIVR